MSRTVDVVVTSLKQAARPVYRPPAKPPCKIAIMRAENPPVHYYRYLYDLIGARWHWVSRKRISDEALRTIITNPAVALYVLLVDGVPAGMAEIDGSEGNLSQIRFFGLAPEFIGMGFGRFFLANAIDLAWVPHPDEVRIETCTLDHPAALPLYQKFGFEVFEQRRARVEFAEGEYQGAP